MPPNVPKLSLHSMGVAGASDESVEPLVMVRMGCCRTGAVAEDPSLSAIRDLQSRQGLDRD